MKAAGITVSALVGLAFYIGLYLLFTHQGSTPGMAILQVIAVMALLVCGALLSLPREE